MKDSPPEPLVELLANLGLAGPAEVRAVTGRVRRLAGGLPLFESLWIDALTQARLLTSWQAVEIDGGRGPALRVGPFVLYERLASHGYATVYRARETDGREFARLAVADQRIDRVDAQPRLAALAQQADVLTHAPLSPMLRHGLDGQRLWAASAWLAGRTARQWLLGQGRCPPAMVLEIARQMLKGLIACERAGVVHAGLGVDQLWFDRRGRLWLPEPGLRGALRPVENKRVELPAEAYDCLSPERALSEMPAEPRDDVFACGALWWQLLTGRPPFAGGTAAAKLHTLASGKLTDIRQVVPDTPEPLAETLMRCLARTRAERPDSLAAVADALGESPPRAARQLARRLRADAGRRRFFAPRAWRRAPQRGAWVAALAGVLLAAVILAWPGLAPRTDPPTDDRPRTVAAAKPRRARKAPAESPAKSTRRPPAGSAAADENVARGARFESIDADAAAVMPADDISDSGAGSEADLPLTPGDDVAHLSADDPAFDFSRLRPRQTLRGDIRRRPVVEVPISGLQITANGVTLENLDFVARQPLRSAAMLTLRGLKTTLRGCSFQTVGDVGPGETPAALGWQRELDASDANADLSTGELDLRDVALRRVAAGVTCRLAAGMILRLDNVLCLESGAAVEFDRFPTADEWALLSVSRVTLRGARSLVRVGCDEIPAAVGQLEIEASGCAFALPAAAALVLFQGEERPGPLLNALRWRGQGCILSPRSRLSIWRRPQGRMLAAADDAVPMEGVVRGEVGFAGSPDEAAAGSRIVRWQAPLISAQPPGIDDTALSLPPADELASSARRDLSR